MSESGTDARAIANCLLDLAKARGVSLSITSLLKILYFAHGWHLAKFGAPLVGQPFEAWQHGPVVRVVYDAFKNETGKPLLGRAKKLDPNTGELEICRYELRQDRLKLLDSVLSSYSGFHPYELSEMTHEEGSPWHKVWGGTNSGANPGMRIPNDSIREYFLMMNSSDLYHA